MITETLSNDTLQNIVRMEQIMNEQLPYYLQFSEAERLEVEIENAEWLREQQK